MSLSVTSFRAVTSTSLFKKISSGESYVQNSACAQVWPFAARGFPGSACVYSNCSRQRQCREQSGRTDQDGVADQARPHHRRRKPQLRSSVRDLRAEEQKSEDLEPVVTGH